MTNDAWTQHYQTLRETIEAKGLTLEITTYAAILGLTKVTVEGQIARRTVCLSLKSSTYEDGALLHAMTSLVIFTARSLA